MRWKRPERHETRTITKFLLFPKTINDETRWLERTSYVQWWNDYRWCDSRWSTFKIIFDPPINKTKIKTNIYD